jgi:hypothetical protein
MSHRKYEIANMIIVKKSHWQTLKKLLRAPTALFVFAASLLAATSAHAAISGRVFQDFNGNGTFNNVDTRGSGVAIDRGIAGVQVRAYSANGLQCGSTATTAADGTYSINAANQGARRVHQPTC